MQHLAVCVCVSAISGSFWKSLPQLCGQPDKNLVDISQVPAGSVKQAELDT